MTRSEFDALTWDEQSAVLDNLAIPQSAHNELTRWAQGVPAAHNEESIGKILAAPAPDVHFPAARIAAIAALAGVSEEHAREIIDPDYTYWSQRGDSTREEHLAFLAGPNEPIADWVRSVARDRLEPDPE